MVLHLILVSTNTLDFLSPDCIVSSVSVPSLQLAYLLQNRYRQLERLLGRLQMIVDNTPSHGKEET